MSNPRLRLFLPLVLIIALPLLAQTHGGAVTIHYAVAGPFLALLAGVLILICAAHPELHRSHLPDPGWADRDFWTMNPSLGTGQ